LRDMRRDRVNNQRERVGIFRFARNAIGVLVEREAFGVEQRGQQCEVIGTVFSLRWEGDLVSAVGNLDESGRTDGTSRADDEELRRVESVRVDRFVEAENETVGENRVDVTAVLPSRRICTNVCVRAASKDEDSASGRPPARVVGQTTCACEYSIRAESGKILRIERNPSSSASGIDCASTVSIDVAAPLNCVR